MQKKIQFFTITFAVVMALCFIPQLSIAQIGNPADDPDLPIDGGVTVLIAAGIGYGIKKIRDERKKQLNKLP